MDDNIVSNVKVIPHFRPTKQYILNLVHLPAGVVVELLALPQTRLWTLSTLTRTGVGVEGLIPWTLCSTYTATQLLIPPLSCGTQPTIILTFTLAFT